MQITYLRQRWLLPQLLLASLLLGCAQSPEQGAASPVPIQSPNDDRDYRYLVLDNSLRVLLVSDPETEKAAAALDVYVGSASNPADRGGLAHFLEHMLFLGTEKYPDAAEYEEFITEHGGSRNAYTAFEHTNYFFDIDHAELAPALDRFAQFFIAPKFDAQYVEREVNAVQAEYQLSIKTDGRRNLDVFREVVNPQHPSSILGVGSTETLANRPGAPIRDDLLDFYQRYYSANLMTLVVLGRQNLDELEALVRPMFTAIPNHQRKIAEIEVPLYDPGTLPLMVYIQPEASERQLQLSFPVPDYSEHYRRKSLQYVGNLLGHEGAGSLLSVLKAEGLAEGLGAGSGLAYRGGAAFNVSITLTQRGMQEREQVLRKVFEYIRMLQLRGPKRDTYAEQGRIAALQFRFRDSAQPMRYVRSLANDLQLFIPEDSLRGNFLMDDFQGGEIASILNKYLTPENVMITVIGKNLPVDRKSKYYFTPYSVQAVAADSSWRHIDDASIDSRMHLPAPNIFIAENVGLKAIAADNPATPALVEQRDNLNIWYRQDDKFRVPKGAIYTSFRSPVATSTAQQAAATQLYVNLLRDSVNEYTYPALLAGLNFSIYKHSRGISLTINGYDDKQLVLLRQIVQSIAGAELDTPRFDNIREDIIRNLDNVKSRRPFSQVMVASRQLLMFPEWSEQDLIAALRELSPATLQVHADKFWRDVQADVLINGNYDDAVVVGVTQALAPLLTNPQPRQIPDLQVVKLAPGDDYVYRVPVKHDDAVLLWYMQAPANDWRSRGLAALSGQILKSGFFQQLRTEQQLGYMVSAFKYSLADVPGLAFMVQSPTVSSVRLQEAVEDFLRGTLGEEQGITAQQFARHKQALINDILLPPKNLWEQSENFWMDIARRQLDFDSRQQLVGQVGAISYEQWRDWFRKVAIDRRATVVMTADGRWKEHPQGREVGAVSAFKQELPSYSIP
jgi:secreted Zn-dependent insulinase-like peptidase